MKRRPTAVEAGALIGFMIRANRGDGSFFHVLMPTGSPDRRQARQPGKVFDVVTRANRGASPSG